MRIGKGNLLLLLNLLVIILAIVIIFFPSFTWGSIQLVVAMFSRLRMGRIVRRFGGQSPGIPVDGFQYPIRKSTGYLSLQRAEDQHTGSRVSCTTSLYECHLLQPPLLRCGLVTPPGPDISPVMTFAMLNIQTPFCDPVD